MQCKSCQGDVPPKFSHAISVNICPLCGNEIMEPELQIAFASLKEAMAAATKYPTEIFDWLKSNYSLYSEEDMALKIKAKEAQFSFPKPRSPRPNAHTPLPEEEAEVQLDQDGNQISGVALQSPEQTRKFFTNAQAGKVLDRQQHFKDLIAKIKDTNSDVSSRSPGGGSSGVMTPEMLAEMGMDGSEGELGEVEYAELNAAFGGPTNEINSGLDGADIYGDEEIPASVLAMAGHGSQGKDAAYLQRQQQKSASAKNQMARSGSVGLIRR